MASAAPHEGPVAPDLDRWFGARARRASYERTARAGPDALWQAAMGVRLRDCRLLGRLVRVRLGIPDTTLTFAELFRTPPFLLLEDGPRCELSGVCGRIWTPRAELATLPDARAFRDWDEPGTARVLFAHWVVPRDGGATLRSEVRVSPVDRRAGLFLRVIEPFIIAFQGLIGVEPLALAVRRAEEASGRPGR
jgi:hypothetical protein